MESTIKKRILTMISFISFGLLFTGLVGAGSVNPLGKVSLVVPTAILEGDTLIMYCKFVVEENSSIYTVKWYKGSREIFRYQPKQYPAKKLLPFKDMQLIIDEHQSDLNKLVVKNVPMALRGNVSCEVTWEPSFTTITETSSLLVVSPPREKPTLVATFKPSSSSSLASLTAYGKIWRFGDKPMIVNISDTLNLNCTSGPAAPAPDLSLFVNGENLRGNRGVTMRHNDVVPTENKTEMRVTTLSLKLDPSHFTNDKKIRINCLASINNLYNETSEEFIGELPPRERAITTASGYGGFGGRNSAGRMFGNSIWPITTIGIGVWEKLVLCWLSISISRLLYTYRLDYNTI